jgi:hypothetical protein
MGYTAHASDIRAPGAASAIHVLMVAITFVSYRDKGACSTPFQQAAAQQKLY